MAEALKCPDCSAPLKYPPNGGPAVQCRFCGSTVLLPTFGAPSVDANDANFAAGLGPLVNKAMEMAQMSNLVRAGKKIEAIRVYRQTFGSDLASAKNAVDKLSAGRPILLGDKNQAGAAMAQAGRAAATGMKVGCALAVCILLFTGLILGLVFHTVSVRQHTVASKLDTIPKLALPASASIANRFNPPVSSFANKVMEFGSKGIGAGQFDDARSIALDGTGKIYVGDYSDGRVQVFDSTGKFLKLWSVGKTSLMNLTASRNGTVYAVTPGHILCFEGATGLALGEAAVTHDDTQETYMDAFAALNGDIYAIGVEPHLVILNSDGQIKKVIDISDKVGEDLSLQRIVVNGLGEIFILDRNKGIFKFAADGRYINRFGGTDRHDPHNIMFAQNLAIDGQGRVFVSANDPAIRVFDGNGGYLDSFGGRDVVFGLAINDHDEVFACFRNKNVVRKFAISPPAKN